MKFIDLTGQKFGRLTVIERAQNKGKHVMWMCECECGNRVNISSDNLKRGNTVSCGCYRSEKLAKRCKKHGHRYERIYRIWCGMKRRCYNAHEINYKLYGLRGITVCDEWLCDFGEFYNWSMSNGYEDSLTIDRIDSNKGYEPSNCHWTTRTHQNNNRRNNVVITYKDKSQTLSQWVDELGLDYKKTRDRLKKLHWSAERAFTTK